MSSGYSATFFAAYKQRNSNSVQGIFMYEKFNSYQHFGAAYCFLQNVGNKLHAMGQRRVVNFITVIFHCLENLIHHTGY
jgi:hypothetical protein